MPRFEPCAPYDLWPANRQDAVDIWAILSRLTHQELRSLVMSYALRHPAGFEEKLLNLWNERSETGDVR